MVSVTPGYSEPYALASVACQATSIRVTEDAAGPTNQFFLSQWEPICKSQCIYHVKVYWLQKIVDLLTDGMFFNFYATRLMNIYQTIFGRCVGIKILSCMLVGFQVWERSVNLGLPDSEYFARRFIENRGKLFHN